MQVYGVWLAGLVGQQGKSQRASQRPTRFGGTLAHIGKRLPNRPGGKVPFLSPPAGLSGVHQLRPSVCWKI